jgi:uncharacterized membrane protein YphA (DoxX/SURF4 family)
MPTASAASNAAVHRIPFLSVGRQLFGAAVAGSGVQQLVTGAFVRLVPEGTAGSFAHSPWPELTGGVLLVAGVAILWGARARLAAITIAALLLASLTLAQLPRALGNPWAGFMWTNPLKALALLGGAVIVAATWDGPRAARAVTVGVVLLAAFLVVCGMQHFAYRAFVATMVPAWIPGRLAWACLTGLALMAGGAGLLVPGVARLAAALSGLMIFLWVPLVHIPRAFAGPNHANESAGIFEALAVSGVALMVAGTRPAD